MAGRGPARWPLVVLVVLLVALGIGTLVGGGDDDDDDDEGAALIERPVSVPIADAPGEPSPVVARRGDVLVTYRVEGSTPDGGAVIDSETHVVRAPYESHVSTVPGEDADADATFLQIAAFGLLQTGFESQLVVEPAVAPGDVVVDVSDLEWRHQTRTVLDRTCQVFRNGSPVDVGRVEAATEADHADICVDEDGLLLHEEWVVSGAVFRVRIATSIDDSPSIDDELFTPTAPRPEGNEAGVLTELTPSSAPPGVDFYALPSAPDGFELRGRFGYAPPRSSAELNQLEPARVAMVLDVYDATDGSGLVVVANGGTSDRSPFVAGDADDERVAVGGALGEAVVLRGLRQHELRVAFDHGRFLRVWGTLPVDDLTALAATLVPTNDPNATLTPVD
jgi:hypothetical protein